MWKVEAQWEYQHSVDGAVFLPVSVNQQFSIVVISANSGDSKVIILGLGCVFRAFLRNSRFTAFHTLSVPDLLPFLMAIKTGHFALVILILITLVTLTAVPIAVFAFSMAFGISCQDQYGFWSKAFLTLDRGIHIDLLHHNVIWGKGCCRVLAHHQFQKELPISIARNTTREIQHTLLVGPLCPSPCHIR